MDNELFMSAGFPPPAHFEPSLTAMPFWQALSSAMEIQTPQLNSTIEQSSECLFNSNWENSTDGNAHFNSALSSMVSSPGDISPHSHQAFLGTPSAYISANNSCYSTPVNSPPKVNLLMLEHLIKENFNKLPSSMPLNSSLPDFSADPGFAERAAKFSCFGSRSFNDRTSQLGMKNAEFPYRSNSLMENRKLPRILSSPSINALGSEIGVQDRKSSHSPLQGRPDLASSREEFIVSEQKATGELNSLNGESNSRKRKAVSRGKAKEQSAAVSFSKIPEANSDSIAKRCKRNEDERQDNADVRADEEKKGNSGIAVDEKQTKANQRPPEPPKDYIHVRARRGQATDSHSLAERVRREKISDRMKLLQDLVPGCNKVNGKALMLEEIINYVQSLQQQVEFLSMKLATVNTIPDFNVNTSVTKNTYQPNNSVPHPIFSIDSSTTSAFYGHQSRQNPTLGSNISSGTVTQCSMDPLNSSLSHNFGMQVPSLNKFKEVVPQFPTYYEDGLQSLVQMGYRKDPNQEAALQ